MTESKQVAFFLIVPTKWAFNVSMVCNVISIFVRRLSSSKGIRSSSNDLHATCLLFPKHDKVVSSTIAINVRILSFQCEYIWNL